MGRDQDEVMGVKWGGSGRGDGGKVGEGRGGMRWCF